jgi:transposase
VSDGRGAAVAWLVSAGQDHDSRLVEPLLDRAEHVACRCSRRARPRVVLADKAYDLPTIRRSLRRRKVRSAIPERSKPWGRRPGRPPSFDPIAYRGRNVVERLVGRLKECRRVATRYEKLAVCFHAVVTLAVIGDYLRMLFPNTA